MDGAGVELQPEHCVSVSGLGSPVIAFDLQRAAERGRSTDQTTCRIMCGWDSKCKALCSSTLTAQKQTNYDYEMCGDRTLRQT